MCVVSRQRNNFQHGWCGQHRHSLLCTFLLYVLFAPSLCVRGEVSADSSRHWAFQTIGRPRLPTVKGQRWVRTPIDHFILAKLEASSLTPSSEAERTTLIRRLTFDLWGLPPTPDQIAEFLGDTSPEAYNKLVERLLASPHYGERWGRQWLDVVGYADSNGYFDADTDRPLAWKYRDYVVRSFNSDKPFDQFVREQIAGDELAGYFADADITPEMVEPLIATHLLRNAPDGTGESDGNAMELRADRYAVLEGTVQILGSAFFGLTLQCARCHDHKFEPVSQDEYYALQAILKPVYNHDQWLKPAERILTIRTRVERDENRHATERYERELTTLTNALEGLTAPFRKLAQEEAIEKISEPLRGELKKALATREKERSDAMKQLLKTNDSIASIKDEVLINRFPELAPGYATLEEAISKKQAAKPAALPQIAAATDITPDPPPHHVLSRGNYNNPGREAAPGVPAVLCRANDSFRWTAPGHPSLSATNRALTNSASVANTRHPASSGRRTALANWITSPENPMFARLTANRIWQAHFGVGLVATADNFGLTGARPTHPELLDWLARQFIESGYQVKALHRLIIESATYREAGVLRPDAFAKDPEDHLLWRYPLRRLEAEAVRDALLAVSGEIDNTVGGPAVPLDKTDEGQFVVNEEKPGAKRRSLYLQQRRSRPATFLDVFDGVKFNPNCAIRVPSTIPLQSLTLLNSDFTRARSKAFAERLAHECGNAVDEKWNRAFLLAWGRPPTATEHSDAIRFLETQQSLYSDRPDAAACAWTDLCQMLMAANAFLYVE
jgi:hypothetical protein